MNGDTLNRNSTDVFSNEKHIDLQCDRFEAAWKAGETPRIEDYVPPIDSPDRNSLLLELLLLELEFRLGGSSPAVQAEYEARFPDESAVVRQAFQAVATDTNSDPGVRLASARTLDDFSSKAPLILALETPHGTLGLGRTIGEYQIISELGRGGMGVVYRARQPRAGREVALKMVRPDRLAQLTTREREDLLGRFRHEAMAAAQVDHPNVLSVYEVGEHEGLPFFSMPLVRGQSLAEKLSNGPLECRLAARYLETVARGLQAAHSHGILHRDVSPKNILIEEHTDRPLVADFGLAKLLEHDQNRTHAGALLGCPPYMAPEQITNSNSAREPADIYALGATLYHALTGRPPFQAATASATLWQVVNEQAALPRDLNPSIDRDLETICTKCLSKESRQRYASAAALADDLQRYLENKPILARPLGQVERLWRWCLRNQQIASVLVGAVTILTIATLFATDGYLRAERERTLAEQRQAAAMRYFQVVCDTLDETVSWVSRDPSLRSQGLEGLRRKQLERASQFYQQLVEHEPDDPHLQAARGRAFFQLGQIDLMLQNMEKARQALDSALQVQTPLCTAYPDRIDWQEQYADSQAAMGHIYHQTGHFDDASDAFKSALRLRQNLLEARPEQASLRLAVSESYNDVGQIHEARSELPAAVAAYAQARELLVALSRERPAERAYRLSLARTLTNVARLDAESEKLDVAQEGYQSSLKATQELLAQQEGDPECLEILAICHNSLADIHHRRDERAAAEREYLAAKAALNQLVTVHPEVEYFRRNLAVCNHNLANLLIGEERFQEAELAQRESLEIVQQLVLSRPAVLDYHHDLARGLINLSDILEKSERALDAEQTLLQARSQLEDLSNGHRRILQYRQDLAVCLSKLAGVFITQSRLDEAAQAHEAALLLRRELAAARPDSTAYANDLAATLVNLGALLAQAESSEAGQASFEEAAKIYTSLAKRHPDNAQYRWSLAAAQSNLSILHANSKRFEQAVDAGVAAIQTLESLKLNLPDDLLVQKHSLFDAHFHLATLKPGEIDRTEMETALQLADKLYRETSSVEYLSRRWDGSMRLAEQAAAEDDANAAIRWLSQASDSARQLLAQQATDRDYAEHRLLRTLEQRAAWLTKLYRHAEASTDLAEAARITLDDQRRWRLQLQLGASLVQINKLVEAVQQASAVAGELARASASETDAEMLVEAARIVASTCGPRAEQTHPPLSAELSDSHAAQALQLLEQAAKRGAFQTQEAVEALKKDTAFEVLHERATWNTLLDELAKKATEENARQPSK